MLLYATSSLSGNVHSLFFLFVLGESQYIGDILTFTSVEIQYGHMDVDGTASICFFGGSPFEMNEM